MKNRLKYLSAEVPHTKKWIVNYFPQEPWQTVIGVKGTNATLKIKLFSFAVNEKDNGLYRSQRNEDQRYHSKPNRTLPKEKYLRKSEIG